MFEVKEFPAVLYIRRVNQGRFFCFQTAQAAKDFVDFKGNNPFVTTKDKSCIVATYAVSAVTKYTTKEVEETEDLLNDGQ